MALKEILEHVIEESLTKLIELAAEGRKGADVDKYRERARTLVQDIVEAKRALQTIGGEATVRYAHHKRAIEAILDYLTEMDRPKLEQEIINALCDGGFRGARPGTALVIQKSIRSYLFGTGRRSGYIKKVGDLIGKGDWEKSRFKA